MTIADKISVSNFNGGDPIRRSPLHSIHRTLKAQFEKRAGWDIPSRYRLLDEERTTVRQHVGICDISAAGVLRVRGESARNALAATFDTVPEVAGNVVVITSDDDRGTIANLTEDEFLILTRPSTRAELRAIEQMVSHQVKDGQFVTVIDQTAGLTGVLIAGPASRTLLSKLCALPFHPDTFPNLYVAQSSLAKVHAMVIRNDLGNVPAFEVYVDRSYAVYVWESVMDAGNEFGVAPVGWRTIESFIEGSTHASEGV